MTFCIHLLNSYTVKLEGLGSFTLIALTRRKGVKTAQEVNPNQVTYLRCQFTPEYPQPAGSIRTRALIQEARFTSVEQFRSMLIDRLSDEGNGDNNAGGDLGETPDPGI